MAAGRTDGSGLQEGKAIKRLSSRGDLVGSVLPMGKKMRTEMEAPGICINTAHRAQAY